MYALSIDTAANLCSVAISDMRSGASICEVSHDIGRGHAEILMDNISQCMRETGIGYSEIDRVISTVGPGSFTGVRVGLSVARAIALGIKKPVIGISNLEACASHAAQNPTDPSKVIQVLIDARRGEVYSQKFLNGKALDEAGVLKVENITVSKDTILCGSGAEIFANCKQTKFEIAHTLATAPISKIAKLGIEKGTTSSHPEPIYLRGADAKQQQGYAIARQSVTGLAQNPPEITS